MRLLLLLPLCLLAQDRPVPPPGVPVSDADRAELSRGLEQLSAACDRIKDHALAPDVLIYREAVRYALTHNEFFKPDEIGKAKTLLKQGMDRAELLAKGQAPWDTATGLVVRGYRSRIDHSIQPYGLVIPDRGSPKTRNWRLDAWFHGRNETLSEVNFLSERQTRPGEFTPPDAIVLHLYGRYCNANKFAGEVDLFEALTSVKKHYRIDENRIAVRGFSMGGAAAWHIAAHHAGLWFAAAPGAGFSESAEFLNLAKDPVQPSWFEKKLWRMYDATEYAMNFFNLPLIAYSGEIDRQKQAADIMARYLDKEGIPLTHIIGPQTPHRYHPDSKIEIDRRLDLLAERGRERFPQSIRFTTFTLAYNRMKWLIVDAIKEHWERATVTADMVASGIQVKTQNVTALTLDFESGGAPVVPGTKATIEIDGTKLTASAPMSDGSLRVHLRQDRGAWRVVDSPAQAGLRKRHGLQGPIDDAFMDSFLFVLPTGEPSQKGVAERIRTEQERAIREWRRQFRGDSRVKKDIEITDADIASANLVLWGDPSSNKLMARIAAQLLVAWTTEKVGDLPAANHYPAYIYPNPLNPNRYVVINSGFTYREFDYLNNARQIPKLPDWAIIDVSEPATGRWPGRVAKAGFFNEEWKP